MNIGDISVIISVLAGMIAIPFAASSISTADDGNYGLAAILNSTPEFAANLSSSIPMLVSKSVSEEGIKYVYRTPFGEYSILISPAKFEEALLKVGKKVSFLQSSSEQLWEISLPSESLSINHGEQKITETYRNLNGYLKIVTENGWVSRNKSGTAPIEELQAGMLRLEKEMNETISLMKNMSEKILNVTPPLLQIPILPLNQSNIVINEFLPTPNTTMGESEWIELYNPTNNTISLGGWSIVDNTTSEASLSGTILAHGYKVLNKSSGDFSFSLNSIRDVIRLKNNTVLVDEVTYGSNAGNAPVPDYSESVGRSPNGVDTGIDSADFRIYITPSPGAANP